MFRQSLLGKRVLVTQADVFMGPVLCEVFAERGATWKTAFDGYNARRR